MGRSPEKRSKMHKVSLNIEDSIHNTMVTLANRLGVPVAVLYMEAARELMVEKYAYPDIWQGHWETIITERDPELGYVRSEREAIELLNRCYDDWSTDSEEFTL